MKNSVVWEIMEVFFFIICICVFLLADLTCGQEHNSFLSKHHQSIESYIMNGYGKRSTYQCDLLNDNPQEESIKGKAHFVMDLDNMDKFDLSTNLLSSHCLLVFVHVNNNQSLAALVNFGWKVVQHKRAAIVVKMSSGMTLDMATNITKLPFLIAAELEDDKEQFLCPTVGEPEPSLQYSMCDLSHTSYKNKLIRVGIIGVPPYLYGNTKMCYETFANAYNEAKSVAGKIWFLLHV